MDLDFDKIFLSKDTLEALKTLNGSNILVQKDDYAIFEQLSALNLAAMRVAPQYSAPFGKIARAAEITDRGRAYLTYLQGLEKVRKRAFYKDALLLLVGSAVTFILDRLDSICAFITHIFQ